MSLEFGKLEVVDRTFTRSNVTPRGQAYSGIKFRRYMSKAGVEKGASPKLKEVFIISDAAFEQLNLASLALTQANLGGKPYLLVLEDKDDVKPEPKFMRKSVKKDGTAQNKTPMFNNSFLKAALESAGVLDATTQENQYLSLTKIEDVTGLPSHVVAVFAIDKDTTVDASADADDDDAAETVAVETNDNF